MNFQELAKNPSIELSIVINSKHEITVESTPKLTSSFSLDARRKFHEVGLHLTQGNYRFKINRSAYTIEDLPTSFGDRERSRLREAFASTLAEMFAVLLAQIEEFPSSELIRKVAHSVVHRALHDDGGLLREDSTVSLSPGFITVEAKSLDAMGSAQLPAFESLDETMGHLLKIIRGEITLRPIYQFESGVFQIETDRENGRAVVSVGLKDRTLFSEAFSIFLVSAFRDAVTAEEPVVVREVMEAMSKNTIRWIADIGCFPGISTRPRQLTPRSATDHGCP